MQNNSIFKRLYKGCLPNITLKMFPKVGFRNINYRYFCLQQTEVANKRNYRSKKLTHHFKLTNHFNSASHLQEIRQYIPDKYLLSKPCKTIENLYLIDTKIARKIALHVLPALFSEQLVCETGAGLGLITTELLRTKIKLIRMYEPCPDFRVALKDFRQFFDGRVELFVKDIFQLNRMSYLDKMDRMNRVGQLLKGVPRKQWTEGPAMTIIGAMPKVTFITYLIRMLSMQSEIGSFGRIQLFTIMRPGDYIKLSSGPESNFHVYQGWSVLFNLLFDHRLLDKFPRDAFLPWETPEVVTTRTRNYKLIETDKLYLVQICLKKKLPAEKEQLIILFYFIRQFFGRGTNKVIPTIEKWLPGCGLNLLLPTQSYKHYYKDLSIYTIFGELTPQEILSLFNEMINHPNYNGSAFAAMIQSELLKYETRDTALDDVIPDTSYLLNDLEEKLES